MSRAYIPVVRQRGRALVCFPWLGAGAAPFRAWKGSLPPELALSAARTGGREDRVREPAPTRWPDLVTELTDDLDLDEPFVFFGHCLGALVAFEVARELRRRGRPLPARLLVVGPAPARATDPGPYDEAIVELRRNGTINPRILDNPEVFALFEPAIRGDVELARGYRHTAEPPLAIPIDVFVATGEEPEGSAEARHWGAETTGNLRVVSVDGDSLLPQGAWAALSRAVFAAAAQGEAG